MSILSTNHRLIKVGQDYSAGSGISIDDHVISVTGNQEASIVVQNNSATWNEISSVSGNYWPLSSNFTAKNSKIDINGLANHHLFLGGANPYIRGVVDGFPYYNWEIHSTHVSGHNWEYGAAEYNKLNSSYNTLSSNSGTWSEVSTTVQTNSAQWSDNTGDEEVNEFVYNNSATINEVNTNYQTNSGKYLTTADSANFYPSNNPSGFITGVDLSNYYTKNDTSSKQEIADAFASVPAGDPDVNSYVQSNSAALNESTNVVQSNSAAWGNQFDPSYMSGAIDNKLDESAFADVSGSFLTAHQSLAGYATEDWVTAQGYITGVDLSEYAKTNDVLDDINSAVSGKLDTTSFSTVSGDFLTAVDLTPYYTTAEAETLSSMLSGAIDYVSANAGDEFPASANEAITAYQNASGTYLTAHQIIPSAKWEDASDCVQSNSAAWAQGGTIASPQGTILVNGYNIEASNSAVVESTSAWSGLGPQPDRENIGPSDVVICHITDVESSESTQLILPLGYSYNAEVGYSANGGTTGSFTTYGDGNYTISTPNSTEVDIWTNPDSQQWIAFEGDITALKNEITTEVIELAPLTALPTYNYDLDDAITGINGSAIGGQGGGVPQSAFDELKASYDTLSSSYVALSSLFATYSGQWLLPNDVVQTYVLSSMTATVEINDGTWDHGGDFGMELPAEVSAFTEGLSQGALTAIFGADRELNKNENIRFGYSKYNLPDDDFCGTWSSFGTGEYGPEITAVLSGFGANSAAPTGYPVYMGFPYLFRSDAGYGLTSIPVTFSGYVLA